ncbi:hypothetical protein [Coraliomargarita akajimensis]|nr:hypothetical protein [Coraliomargarita akajimensis]
MALLSCFLVACASKPKAEIQSVDIDAIYPRYMETSQFKRIHEYRTGVEYAGNRVIIRTDPDVRDGYYFVLQLDTKAHRLPQGTTILAEFYTPSSPAPQQFTFELPAKRPKTKEIFIGLTGEIWPYAEGKATPAAWKFTLLDANGNELGQKQSYLWSM